MSPLTIASYRDALKLLLRFTAERMKRRVVDLGVADIDTNIVRDFLQHLEGERGNAISTRNNRLAAIRSFFSFAAGEEPSIAEHCRRVCSVPLKRAPIHAIPYLEDDEMQALLAAPNQATAPGRRDYALLLFLYNAGARVQELTGVRAPDLKLARPAHVLLRGKGRKERVCPLWSETARALRSLLEEMPTASSPEGAVFRNAWGDPITRFGVDHVLKKHAAIAARTVPSLGAKRVSPHVIRHTAAVHMLNSGIDVNVIRAWLGHADLRTTNIYAEINLATRRKAIESCSPEERPPRRRQANWKRKPDLLEWLEQL
jgi:site-specific recombinase XerD